MSNKEAVKKKPSLLSPIFTPISIMVSILGYIVGSIILGTLIDYLGIWMDWWDTSHQLNILKSDINYLGENFTTSIFGVPPQDLAVKISESIHNYLTFSTHITNKDFFIIRLFHDFLITVEPFWRNLVYSAMTVGVRCFIVILSVLFFVIVGFVATVDGLVQRELRKEGGGIEHAQIYHHAKTWVGRVLIISPMIYLSWPETINPGWIIFPSALAFGMAIFVTFSTFKKNL